MKRTKSLLKISALLLVLCCVISTSYAQEPEKSKSEIRKEKREAEKQENAKRVNELIAGGKYSFIPTIMSGTKPRSTRDITGYEVVFTPEEIVSYLPFFGSMDMVEFNSPDTNPMSFVTVDFSCEREDVDDKIKFTYEIEPTEGNNHYKVYTTIYPETGKMTMNVNQNRGDSMNYSGTIEPTEERDN